MTFSSDQNLLFGIVALQMDFVRREQFVSATNKWLTNKSRRIDEILVEQGALSEEDRQLLSPLVARHLENHEGDPQQSLATLSSIGSVADELRSLGDDDIAATLSIVGSSLREPNAETVVHDPVGSSTASPVYREATDTRFRVLRSHAKGGLGEVYVAKDTELNREVALKEIQAKYADDENNRLRFLLEAEVTGGLEHPGIVPVYGLGRYEDGRPFYAMRFVKGDSLQEAAERFHGKQDLENGTSQAPTPDFECLEFRKLLGRFIDVCQAIEYAHSRGVLHRDLKPGNIMLGKYGETLVVDWGLAKAQGRDESDKVEGETILRPASASGSAPTMMGSAIGTPAFMPPEQAAGDLDRLGPASDVYSLGATLYYLLTGRPPFSGKDLREVLSNVQASAFPSPKRIQPLAPSALTAICLKAMAARPQDRYTSPQSLAEDVERFLADETVSAFREPITLRVRRWVRKHPAVSASTVAVVFLSVIGLGLFSSILQGKNADLAQAVKSLRESNTRETAARSLAETNERSARAQSQLAYSTLSSVIGDLQLGLRDVPATGEVRRRILKASLPNLDKLATEFVSATIVDVETAWVLINLGDLTVDLGSGSESIGENPAVAGVEGSDPRSPLDLANKFYGRSLAISKKLLEEDADNGNARAKLALAYDRLGSVAARRGDATGALAAYENSLKNAKRLAADHPDSVDGQRTLARAQMMLGDFYVVVYRKEPENLHYREQAERYAKTTVEMYESLVEKLPDETGTRQDLALSYLRMGSANSIGGAPAAAIPWFEKAVKILTQLLELEPSNVRIRRNLAATLDRILIVQRTEGRLEEARDTSQKICAIAEKIVEDNPSNLGDRNNLASGYNNLALVLVELKQWDQALIACQKSIDGKLILAEILPNDLDTQVALAATYRQHSWIQSNRNEWDEAIASRQRSITIQTHLAKESPDNVAIHLRLATDFNRAAELNLKQGRSDAALESLKSGVRALEDFLARKPDVAEVLKAQVKLRLQLGLAYQEARHYEAAGVEFGRAAKLGQKTVDAGLNDAQTRINLAMAQHYSARVKLIIGSVLGDWNQLMQQPKNELPAMLNFRADEFIHRRKFAAAAQAASKVRDFETANVVELYNSACHLCACATSINAADTPTGAKQKEVWIVDAIASLKKAIEAGFDDFDHMQKDEDLVILRDRPLFKALIPKSD